MKKPPYKALADDDDSNLSIQEALKKIREMTLPNQSEEKLSYTSIANRTNFATAAALQPRVQAMLPPWVDAELDDEGIDVNNAQLPALLNSIVGGDLTQPMVDGILALKPAPVPKYTEVKEGWLITARDMRARGEI